MYADMNTCPKIANADLFSPLIVIRTRMCRTIFPPTTVMILKAISGG